MIKLLLNKLIRPFNRHIVYKPIREVKKKNPNSREVILDAPAFHSFFTQSHKVEGIKPLKNFNPPEFHVHYKKEWIRIVKKDS